MIRAGLTLMLLLMLTGCSTTNASPLTPSPGKQDMANIQFDESFYKNTGLAIAPVPVEIGIANVELGANFEWYAYLHNGDGVRVKELVVQTEPGEVKAEIPIRVTLASNELSDIVRVDSTLKEELLKAVSYNKDTRSILIDGFIPNERRILRVFYKSIATYELSYFITSKAKAGYVFMPSGFKDFVTIEPKTVTMQPFETKKILIKCSIPPGTKFPAENLEFGIAAHESAGTGATMQMTVGICQQVLVNLK